MTENSDVATVPSVKDLRVHLGIRLLVTSSAIVGGATMVADAWGSPFAYVRAAGATAFAVLLWLWLGQTIRGLAHAICWKEIAINRANAMHAISATCEEYRIDVRNLQQRIQDLTESNNEFHIKHDGETQALRAALGALLAVQNGPPLIAWKDRWEIAVKDAEALLGNKETT